MLSAEQEIEELERRWMSAWIRKDRDTCDSILADDFLLTSARGILLSKKEWLDGAMGPIEGEAFDWEQVQVRLLAPDVALVHAKTSQTASVSGQDWSGTFLLSDVWVNRDGHWQVVARHGTGPLSS